MNLLLLSLKEIAELLKKGEISPVAVVTETLKAVKLSRLNAFITVCEEQAIAQAEEAALRIAKGEARTLEGVPLGIKDLFCTKGIKTTAGSKLMGDFVPWYESTVTERLLNQGCIFVGKNNLDEFGMGSTNKNSAFGQVRNPIDENLVPGGSSGGSAAAVAAGLCYAALGTDTGGSVRQPAAFCGVVGVKPSYGVCSRFGMIAYASSMDQAGVIARSVEDACLVLDIMKGPCDRDSMSSKILLPKLAEIPANVKGMRIGYIEEHMSLVNEQVRAQWEKSLKLLKEMGAETISINIHDLSCKSIGLNCSPTHSWLGVYYSLSTIEALSNLARYDGIRYGSYVAGKDLEESYLLTRDQFGPEVKRRLALAAHIMLTEPTNKILERSSKYRQFLKERFGRLFKRIDCLVSPTSPHVAFPLAEFKKNSIESYMEDIFTVVANLVDSPAISIPAGENNGLPIGMHIMAGHLQDAKMIAVAKALEGAIRSA